MSGDELLDKKKRKGIFTLIALSIPFIVVGLLEVSLRVIGFGGNTPLFIENPNHSDYLLARPDIIKRYFPEGYAPHVTLEPSFFLKQKPTNGFRVVVQGGSTAAGFPYGLGASLAGMLDQRLKQSYPQHHVEVINVAMSAVNSYFLLDTSEEIIAQQPDAIVIYAGHNEYLGIFGVGSTFTAFQQPVLMGLFLSFRELALFDALQSLMTRLQSPASNASGNSRTLMSQVARHKDIAFDSEKYRAGIHQFESNMRKLITRYADAGIPVFIATLASNEKDQKPFSSAPTLHDMASLSLLPVNELLTLSMRTSNSAEWHFSLANALLENGRINEAKKHFTLAKEHDLLRFRAPEAMNESIKQLANNQGVSLFNVQQAMQARSPNGIVGNNLMLEHLHPNLPGYFVIADTAYKAIIDAQLISPATQVTSAQAWKNRPVTPAEEYYGFAHIQALKADYPFSNEPQPLRLPTPADWQQQLGKDYFDKKTDWLGMMQKLQIGYEVRNNQSMAMKVKQLLADALPHNRLLNQEVATWMQQQGRLGESAFYFQRAERAANKN